VEKQTHIGVGGGLSMLSIDDKSTMSVGAGGGVDFRYGLTDAFNLHVEAGHSVVAANQEQDTPTTPLTRPSTASSLAAGAAYTLDIIRIVPYGCILAGATMLRGGTLPSALVLPDVQLGLGLDYYLTRNWGVGVAYRQHLMLSKLSTYPSYSNAWLRAEYTFF
jgi:opacity protein-like surface antigen